VGRGGKGKEGMGRERRGREEREGNGSMHPLGFSKVGAYGPTEAVMTMIQNNNGTAQSTHHWPTGSDTG